MLANANGDLAELEGVIANGMLTFVEVGRALAKIRDLKLYAANHKTFDAYCKSRWGMGRAYAYRQIAAAEVVANWRHDTLDPPDNESQARQLAKLPAAKQVAAWQEAVTTSPSGQQVTAQRVALVVASMLPQRKKTVVYKPPPEASRAAPPAPAPAPAPAPPVDKDDDYIEQNNTLWGLESLARQRDADPEFAEARRIQRAVTEQLPSRAQRMIGFILDGGELALLRLGLNWTVTPARLKDAYREEAKEHHPDRGGLSGRFKQLQRDRDLIAKFLEVRE
jgi:hypothetical protein